MNTRSRPDVAICVALACFFVGCSLMYLPGHQAWLAWHNIDNSVFYATRFAYPELYPNDWLASYQRNVVPLGTVVHLLPALMLKYLHLQPWYATFGVVALNDLLIVLAVYWLSRGLGMARDVSVLAGLFTVGSRVLSWNLAGYEYMGHDFAYTGSFFIPFAVAVIPSLIYGRIDLALVFTTIDVLVFAPAGAVMLGVVVVCLAVRPRADVWRSAAPWLALPVLALAGAAVMQLIIRSAIKEPISHAEDLQAVIVNGHFVPLWIYGNVMGSPYLGFFMWSGLSVLAARGRWAALATPQKAPILVLGGVVLAGVLLGLLAVLEGWLFVLRFGLFRYSLLLGIVCVPFVTAYLVDKIRGEMTGARIVAFTLFVLLAVDRGTAWVLPLAVPCLLFLAIDEFGRPPPRWVGNAVAIACVLAALDLLWHVGVLETMAASVDPTRRLSRLLAELSHRQEAGGRELLLLPLIGVPAVWTTWRRRREAEVRGGGHVLVRGLCAFLFACLAVRTATAAVWSATGAPGQFAAAQLWARASTPIAAKFVFLDVETTGDYPSWQTLSQRGAAELQYSWQKAYSPDRELLTIDKRVTALYGFDPASVASKPYPYYVLELYEKYKQFGVEDFLRAARLSGSNFVVLKRPQTLEFPIAYQNNLFVAYRVPARFGDVTVSATQMTGGSITLAWPGADDRHAARRLFVEFRDARSGRVAATDCCAAIQASSGEHTFRLPSAVSGTYLAFVGVIDEKTGARLPLDGDASGENLAFWDYLALAENPPSETNRHL